MRNLLRFATGVLALASMALAVTGAPARAQDTMSSHYGGLRDHCVGTRIESHQIKNKRGKVVGRTELWYSRAKGGQNCVMTYNRAGKPFTRTYIWRLKRKGGLADASAADSGFYKVLRGRLLREQRERALRDLGRHRRQLLLVQQARRRPLRLIAPRVGRRQQGVAA